MIDRAERPLRFPAWCASIALHGTLLLGFAWFFGSREPEGAAESSFREVGVVLRQEPVELLDSTTETSESPAEPTESPTTDLSSALPEAPSASPFAELMAELTAEGPAPGEEGVDGGGQGQGRPALPIGQARVSVFGVEGTGSRFVYAFDRSISMRGPPLRAAKSQLVASLDSLEATHQFQILFFNHRVSAFDLTGGQQRIAFATEQTKQLARGFVTGVTADGSTDRYGALSRALRLRPDVIFFLTDVDSPMTHDEMQKIARLNEWAGASICTIEFGSGPNRGERNFLVQLAEQTGGQYGYVDTLRLAR